MKYWWGYLVAAIFGGFTWMLTKLGETYSGLVDMVYPYVTRSVQTILSGWTGTVDVLVWQVIVVLAILAALVILGLVFLFKDSLIRYVGWVLAVVSIVVFLNTGIYGLNYHAGPLTDDLRMELNDYTMSDLVLAVTFYRDRANELSTQVERDSDGAPVYGEFKTLAAEAGEGFRTLTVERSFSVFGGDTSPVKALGWADMYTSMGITGFTCFLTGEAAVNPQIPAVSLPFTMCHEMAHRMCIAQEDEANFAAFLACEAHSDVNHRYSGYFMALQYCMNALSGVNPEKAAALRADYTPELNGDVKRYNEFFSQNMEETATKVADTVNDTYLKASGDEDGIASYGAVCDQLVNWYLQEYATAEDLGEPEFDPYDETQVDLSGNIHYKPKENG